MIPPPMGLDGGCYNVATTEQRFLFNGTKTRLLRVFFGPLSWLCVRLIILLECTPDIVWLVLDIRLQTQMVEIRCSMPTARSVRTTTIIVYKNLIVMTLRFSYSASRESKTVKAMCGPAWPKIREIPREKCNAEAPEFKFVCSFSQNPAIQTSPKVSASATTWCLLTLKLLERFGSLSFEKSCAQIWKPRYTFRINISRFPYTQSAELWTPPNLPRKCMPHF